MILPAQCFHIVQNGVELKIGRIIGGVREEEGQRIRDRFAQDGGGKQQVAEQLYRLRPGADAEGAQLSVKNASRLFRNSRRLSSDRHLASACCSSMLMIAKRSRPP